MPNLPYRLSDGIFFEDTGILLPWNASLKDLRKIGKPKIRKEADKTHLYWQEEHLWLDGLRAYFNTTFFDSKYAIGLARSEHINQNLSMGLINFSTSDGAKSPRLEFERVKAHLMRTLGQPTFFAEDYKFGLPLVEWHIQEILLVFMVFERFGEYCVGEVWHNPPAWRLANNHQS
jgi:hypothetical protein